MPHVPLADKLHPAGLALLERAEAVTHIRVEEISAVSRQPWLAEVEAVVSRSQPVGAASTARATRSQIVARMAAALGMQVQACDPGALEHGWSEGPARPVTTLEEELALADVISVQLPGADRPIPGAEELALVERGAVIINTALGRIVDEAVLAAASISGQVGAAGLDVSDARPSWHDHPLLALDRIIPTAHTAGLTAVSAERMAMATVQNVPDHLAGHPDPALIANG